MIESFPTIAATEITLSAGWVLSAIATLCGTIASLAAIMWGFVQKHIAKQDMTITQQGIMISKLQDDVARLSRGCGAGGCVWRHSNDRP